jgi:tetratricopeptide (TPR) repeat protein
MSRVLLRLVLLAVLGSAAAPVRVSAQPAPAAVDKKQVARDYTQAGLAAAKLGDYDTAINFYQKAYQLVPHPTLIFNIAEAQRLAGRIENALSLYKRYLSEAPAGPLAQDARDRIAEIEAGKAEEARKLEDARRAEEDRKAAERKAEEDRKAAERKAEDDRKAAEARKVAEAGQERERAATAAAAPSGPPGGAPVLETSGTVSAAPVGSNLRVAGIATGAGGIASVAIGIGFAIHSRTLNDRVSNKPGMVFDPNTDSAGQRANTIAYVGTIGGTVLVATGAALYWWGYTQGRSAEGVSIAPLVSDRLAGLVVTGTWR